MWAFYVVLKVALRVKPPLPPSTATSAGALALSLFDRLDDPAPSSMPFPTPHSDKKIFQEILRLVIRRLTVL